MTTQNINSINYAIASITLKQGETWEIIPSKSKTGKQIQYVNILDNQGNRIAMSGTLCNISNKTEIFYLLKELAENSTVKSASCASACVQQAHEMGNRDDQAMTYAKHVDWVNEVQNRLSKDAVRKNPQFNKVKMVDVAGFNIKTWAFNIIDDYAYSYDMLKSFETFENINSNYYKLSDGRFILKHTRDCIQKAIRKYNDYILEHKTEMKQNEKMLSFNFDNDYIYNEIENTCMV